jgi:hypothetical protein
MATSLGAPPATTRRQSTGLCILVGAVVVAGWVLYRHYLFPHVSERVFRWRELGRWLWLAELVQSLLLTVPYALALLLWGRDLARSLRGAALALVSGVYVAGLDYVFERYVFGLDGHGFDATSERVYEWLNLLGVALLVPLAWGVARRNGRAWVAGLVVGPVVAGLLRELQQHWRWWQSNVAFSQHHWSWVLQAVVFVAPLVLAVLACCAIDRGSRPSPETARPSDPGVDPGVRRTT